jgi:cytochrome c oxidase subunit 3
MEIPYTVKPRPDTGLYNAKVGIWLFLASEVMLFGAFISSYILLRVGAPDGFWPDVKTGWPHGLLNIPIGTFNTAVLIASSVTVVMAWAALKMGNLVKFKRYMAFTVACALGFLGIKSYEYNEKFTHYVIRMKDGKALTGHFETEFINGFLEKANARREKQNTETEAQNQKSAGKTKRDLLPTLSKRFLTLEKFQAEGTESVKLHVDVPNQFRYPVGMKHEAAPEHSGEAHAEAEIKLADVESIASFIPSTATFFAIYFTMTFLHGLHVLAGALVLAYFATFGSKMWKTEPERFTNRIEVAGLFWHFVDLVWIFLFPVVYLL